VICVAAVIHVTARPVLATVWLPQPHGPNRVDVATTRLAAAETWLGGFLKLPALRQVAVRGAQIASATAAGRLDVAVELGAPAQLGRVLVVGELLDAVCAERAADRVQLLLGQRPRHLARVAHRVFFVGGAGNHE